MRFIRTKKNRAPDGEERYAVRSTCFLAGYGFGRTVGQRLCALLQENLTAFPAKYPLYDVEPWSSAGIRQYATRNDVILYSVDEIHSYVHIRSVCTRGRNLDLHLSEQSESIE